MSPTTTTDRHEVDISARDRLLIWFGFLGAPLAWGVHLAAAWALVPVACEVGSSLVLHAITLVTGLVAAAAIVVAHRTRTRGLEAPAFLGVTGFWMGVLFLVLIVLEGLPVLALDACG